MPPPKKKDTPQSWNVTLFGHRVFTEVIKLRSSGWTLTQYDWYSHKKGKSAYRERHTKRLSGED